MSGSVSRKRVVEEIAEEVAVARPTKSRPGSAVDVAVPLWDTIENAMVDERHWPGRSRLQAYLKNNPSYVEYTGPPKAEVPNQKLKTIMDLSYEMMILEMSSQMNKADLYDHWLDMSTASKQVYIDKAKEKIRNMNVEDLKTLNLTGEEKTSLGLTDKFVDAWQPQARADAGDEEYSSNDDDDDEDDDDDSVEVDNENGEEEEEENEEDEDEEVKMYDDGGEEEDGQVRRNLRAGASSASLLSIHSSNEGDDLDGGKTPTEAARERLGLSFLKAASDKYKPPAVGLQHQAVIEPWVPLEERVGAFAHLADRDCLERQHASAGIVWTQAPAASEEDAEARREEATVSYLREALLQLKATMKARLCGPESPQRTNSAQDTRSPVVDGTALFLRPHVWGSLLLLLHSKNYDHAAALSDLKEQCARDDSAFFSVWSHNEQERAFASFSKYGDDLTRLSGTLSKKSPPEVVDYFCRFLEAGRQLESDCRLDRFLEQAQAEADESAGAEVPLRSEVGGEDVVAAEEGSSRDGGSRCKRAPLRSALDVRHKFALPKLLRDSLPDSMLASVDGITAQAAEIARTQSDRDNGALMQLQKIKTIAFMLQARRSLDDISFALLMNALVEYRRHAVTAAELVVRVRWLCNFSRVDCLDTANGNTGPLNDLFRSFLGKGLWVLESLRNY